MEGRGFTLIELSTTLALLALLALVGVPGLREFLRDCERSATVNSLLQAVHGARRIAAVSGRRVDLCPTRDGVDCSGEFLWDGDLLLRPDTGSPFTHRILPSPARHPPQTVRANRRVLSFTPLRPAATTATLTVCDDRGARAAVAVIVSRAGRPRVADRDPGGRALVCP